MTVIKDEEIYDLRNLPGMADINSGTRSAIQSGFEYVLHNGLVVEADERSLGDNWQDAVIFFPPNGFYTKESLPFVGWKEGYEYQGSNQWFLEQNVGCPPLSNPAPSVGSSDLSGGPS